MSTQFSFLFGGQPSQPPMPAEDYLPPRSRAADPQSSKRAEADAKRTGLMRGQRVLSLELVEKYPGRTSKELASLGTLDRYVLAKRLPELRKMRLVQTTQAGSEDMRWWPISCEPS